MHPVGSTPPEGITREEWTELIQLWIDAPDYGLIGTEKMRALLGGLTRECPAGGNPDYCCLHRIREIPNNERIAWVMKLNDVELEAIYTSHLQCCRCREETT